MNFCDFCSDRIVDADLAEFGHVRYRRTLCRDCFQRAGKGEFVAHEGGSMEDGGWPIYDELTLARSITDFQRLAGHAKLSPEDVIVERIPEIANHIVNRAFELNLQDSVPVELTDRVFGEFTAKKLGHHLDGITELADQLARETRASSTDGGDG